MVLRSEVGATVVTFTLYGDVTPERQEREQGLVKHRAEQLALRPKRVVREYVEYGNLLD